MPTLQSRIEFRLHMCTTWCGVCANARFIKALSNGPTPTPQQLHDSQKHTTCLVLGAGAATLGVTAVTFGTAGGVLGLTGVGAPVGVILLGGAAVTGILAGGMALGAAFYCQ